MSTFEEELARLDPVLTRIVNFCLFGKKVVVRGSENFLKKGPNIIVGNHVGSYKDIAALYKIVPRPVFFTANREIFDRTEFDRLIRLHLKRHLKDFGPFLDLLLRPLKSRFVNFISTNIEKVGTVAVDLEGTRGRAIIGCQERLKQGRAVILLQGRGRVIPGLPNPYVPPFRKGPSVIAYKLYKDAGISVPITPVALFGAQKPWIEPGKIKMNVGKPLHISDYISGGFKETVVGFINILEKRIKTLLYEIIKS